MELEFLQLIQKLGSDFFDAFFCGISLFGELALYIALIPIFYWCIDKGIGEELVGSVFMGGYLNCTLKGISNRARPIATHGDQLRRVKYDYFYTSQQEGGFFLPESFPSGHSQVTASFCSTIVYRKGARRFWAVLLIPILIAVSRMYIGLHWPSDVLFGLLEGFVVSALIHGCLKTNKRRTLMALPIISLPILLLFFFGVDTDQVPRILMMLMLIWGGCLGILLENKYIGFLTGDLKFSMRLLRIPVGILAVLLTAGIVFLPLYICGLPFKIALIPSCFVAALGMTVTAPILFKMFRIN